jgi:hypothetical protein
MAIDTPKRKPIDVDEAPAEIRDHAFEPRGAWYTLCKHCDLAEAAHSETTIDSLAEIRADHERQKERRSVRIGYVGDDDDDRSLIGYVGDDDDD